MKNTFYHSGFSEIPGDPVNKYAGRTILITGGRGYIGSALAQSLTDVDCKLILVDRSPVDAWKPVSKKAEVVVLNGDLSMQKTWEKILPKVDYVFHLAAQEYFYRSEYDPQSDLKLNALPVLHLLEVCRLQNNHPKIVFASSANLFGSVETLPVNEDVRDNPLTVWAIHKLLAEAYLRLYADQFGISSITLRLSNVYGPTARKSAMNRVVLNKMIDQAQKGGELCIYSNKECLRDFVFLEDVVEAFLLAGVKCGSTRKRLYVIGSGEGRTIEGVWQLIADSVKFQLGKNVSIRFDNSVKIEPVENRNFVADSARFQKETGWKSRTRLAEGIRMTLQTFL